MARKKKLRNSRPTLEVCQSESISNAANTLLANIRFSSVDTPIKSIAVCSSVPNEGKSTVVLALAMAMGQLGKRCLLLDGDMRRRSLAALIGVKPRYGMHSLLTGRCKANEAIVATNIKGVHFLNCEAGIPNPEELLSSRAFGDLLAHLHSLYDYVLIDTPPVTTFADACVIASRCDGVAFVIREGYTDRREALFALDALKSANAHVLGSVLNAQTKANSSAYSYYYNYYYSEESVPAVNIDEQAQKIKGRHSSESAPGGLHEIPQQKSEAVPRAAVDDDLYTLVNPGSSQG